MVVLIANIVLKKAQMNKQANDECRSFTSKSGIKVTKCVAYLNPDHTDTECCGVFL